MYSCYGNMISQLQGVTCHTGSHSVTCHATQVNTPRLNPSQTGWSLIYLPTPEAELTQVTSYVPRWFTCLQTVIHPSTNPAVPEEQSCQISSWSTLKRWILGLC